MGIDCEFRASSIIDVSSVLALPDVHKIYRPGETSFCPEDRWVITTLIKFVGHGDVSGYAPDSRVPKVAALLRTLRLYCTDLEYGGDNGVPFESVTDVMISEIERAEPGHGTIDELVAKVKARGKSVGLEATVYNAVRLAVVELGFEIAADGTIRSSVATKDVR